MKKLISMFMVLAVLGGVVVGCSGGEKAEEGAAPAAGTEKPAEGDK